MRKLVTTAAMALTLGVMGFATPAMADNYPNQGGYNQPYQGQPHGGDRDGRWNQQGGYQDSWSDRGFEDDNRAHNNDRRSGDRRWRDPRFDFDRYNGNFDRWERGWGNRGFDDFRLQRPLSYWHLKRRIEAQGYYGLRDLRPARWGFGYRAFAYTYRGRPVMLRINPITGRVLDVRYI